MKILRIDLRTLLFVFAFFPALAQAQSGVFRVYAGLAPTSYHITLDIPGAFNATAKSTYAAANLGATWVSPRGIYVDVSGQTSLNAKHDLWEITGDGRQKFLRDSYTLTGGYIHALPGGVSISGFGGYTYGKTIFYTPPSFGYSKDIFESKGIFVGAGAGGPALRGQFSGSLAVAGMKGHQNDDNGFDIKTAPTISLHLAHPSP